MNTRIFPLTRIIAAVCALSLIGVLFLPIWKIELTAPQYPEGLVLKIYADKLGGDVAVVNGLNHYIGMRTLHEKDFVEFIVLPYIIGTLVFFGLLSVLINRRWFFITWAGFYLLFAIMAMVDFYRWEYNYGHNLDPAAPIQVPGMSYQPPLIGYKELLNFGAYSIPGLGGWIFIGVGLLLFISSLMEIRKLRRKIVTRAVFAPVCIAMLLLAGCNNGPQPIRFGSDACEFCKMTIIDKRFGSELITKKGKVYKFDDVHCLTSFLQSNTNIEKETGEIYFVDFSISDKLVKAGESFLLQSEELRSPMGSNIGAFANEDSMHFYKQQFNGNTINWHELYK